MVLPLLPGFRRGRLLGVALLLVVLVLWLGHRTPLSVTRQEAFDLNRDPPKLRRPYIDRPIQGAEEQGGHDEVHTPATDEAEEAEDDTLYPPQLADAANGADGGGTDSYVPSRAGDDDHGGQISEHSTDDADGGREGANPIDNNNTTTDDDDTRGAEPTDDLDGRGRFDAIATTSATTDTRTETATETETPLSRAPFAYGNETSSAVGTAVHRTAV